MLFALWLTFSAIVISLLSKKIDRFAVIKLCHPLKKRNGIIKVKVSILKATHRESESASIVVHIGRGTVEVKIA